MKAIYEKISFNLQDVMSEELPYARSFYLNNQNQFHADVGSLFEFFTKNEYSMPIYTIKQSSCLKMETVFNQTYQMMIEAVGLLFNKHYHQIPKFYDSELVNDH